MDQLLGVGYSAITIFQTRWGLGLDQHSFPLENAVGFSRVRVIATRPSSIANEDSGPICRWPGILSRKPVVQSVTTCRLSPSRRLQQNVRDRLVCHPWSGDSEPADIRFPVRLWLLPCCKAMGSEHPRDVH